MLAQLIQPGAMNTLLVNPPDVQEVISQILGWPVDELGDIVLGDNCYDTPQGRVRFVNFSNAIDAGYSPDTVHRRQTYISRLNKHAAETNEAVIVLQGFKWRQAEGSSGYHFTTHPRQTVFTGQLGMAVIDNAVTVFRDKQRGERSRMGQRFPFERGGQ